MTQGRRRFFAALGVLAIVAVGGFAILRAHRAAHTPKISAATSTFTRNQARAAILKSVELLKEGPKVAPILTRQEKRVDDFLSSPNSRPDTASVIENQIVAPLLKDMKAGGLSPAEMKAVLHRLGKNYYSQAWIWGEAPLEGRRELKIRLLRLSIAHLEAQKRT